MDKLISIIIRTRNEERWIKKCLASVYNQNYKNIEVVLVDNQSTDKTVDKAKKFGIDKIVEITKYMPGYALNQGIKESRGDYIVCLSGHCIPIDEHWLSNLYNNFIDDDVAGVYGKQEPMSFSSDSDKRDLTLVFGMDKRIQKKDNFFHNANSMIPRKLWEKVPFDENATNIEDRIWAKEMQTRGYKIVYEPNARVYHYHGIHQDGNIERLSGVAKILDQLNEESQNNILAINHSNIVAIIPVKGPLLNIGKENQLFYTIQKAKESKFINKIIVSTDNEEIALYSNKLGIETPFLRDPKYSKDTIDMAQVIKYSLDKIEDGGIYPDVVITLEPTFPFRPPCFIDDMLLKLINNGLDSVIAARKEIRGIWKEIDNSVSQIDEGNSPRSLKEPTFIELRGIGCATHPDYIREGKILGNNIGIIELNNPYSHIEVRNNEDVVFAQKILEIKKDWFIS